MASDEIGAKQDTLSVQSILHGMSNVYANCKSYRDSGVVKTIFTRSSREWTVRKPFRTAFVRPDRFRFEFSDASNSGTPRRCIIWHNGNDTQTWWDIKPGVNKTDWFIMTLTTAAGISDGSSITIPALLLPDEFMGLNLSRLSSARRIGDAMIGKRQCFRIEGKVMEKSTTIWIDKETFLVRMIASDKDFEGFSTEETTTYEPIVNEEIPDGLLEFRPPGM